MVVIHANEERRAVLRIVVVYALLGGLWIYLSDSALGLLVSDLRVMTTIATYKGLLFIALTSALLYFLISRYVFSIKEKTRQLKISEDRFQSIYHGISDAILIHDAASGAIISVNRTACEMFGYSFDEMLAMDVGGMSLGEPPYSQNDALDWLHRAAQGTPQKCEWVSKRKDGSIFWAEVSMRAETIGDDRPIIVSLRDISDRKQSMEQFNAIIQTTKDGFWICDTAGRLLEVNQSYCNMIGYSREELLRMSIPDLEITERAEDVTVHIRRIVARGSDNFESRQRRKDGNIIAIDVSVTFLQKHGGRFYSFIRDITEREKTQKELLRIQKLESLGVLAGGIAHDFNNILTGIMGNISFARMHLDDSHTSNTILLDAEKASRRASDLARQLLTFAKGGQPITKVVSLRQVVDSSLSLTLRGSNVRQVIQISDSLPAIVADEGQLNQVFSNIIINAAQAMPDGGTITISAAEIALGAANALSLPVGDYIRITFTDTGCGMSDETQKRIFDPYFTTKATGSGLGLASVYSIIKNHGGTVSVRSRSGQGSSFDILLPASRLPAPETTHGTTLISGEHVCKSVLIMDDEEMIRELAAVMLGDLGYQVQTCASGDEAIARYRTAMRTESPFWAVIMDLTIPGGMSGTEAARQILQFDPEARLIVSSGYSNDPVMAEFRKYGFCGTVAKPYTFTEIAQVLEGL
jgi:PAS domain S-box-containing protein